MQMYLNENDVLTIYVGIFCLQIWKQLPTFVFEFPDVSTKNGHVITAKNPI